METTIHTHNKAGEIIIINIRLSDPCKNGHNDFAITADIYKPNSKVFNDRNWLSGGCQHEEILAVKPSLKQFIDLHLSNEDGEPMYAIENGFYHLEGVQGVAKYNHKCSLENFAQYMRVDLDEAIKVVNTIHDKADFIKWVDTLRPVWKKEADHAKNELQMLVDRYKPNGKA